MYNKLTLMLNFLLHIVTVQPVRVTSSLEIQLGANPFSYKKNLAVHKVTYDYEQ